MFHDEELPARLPRKLKKELNSHIRKNRKKYSSSSHFVRVAIIRLIREDKEAKKNDKKTQL